MPVNQAKLDKLKAQGEGSRIGGKGTARRKKKVVHKTATDDKRLQVGLSLYWAGSPIHFDHGIVT